MLPTLLANSLLAQIDNSNGGSIGSGANVTLNLGGDLTTQGDATFQILNFDLGGGPGTIGVDATMNVTANNISTGGALCRCYHKFWRHHRRECHNQRDCSQHYHRRLL